MNAKRIVVVLAVLACVASVAVADPKVVGNGKWLHDKWIAIQRSESPRSMDLAVYDGFIIGVVQTAEFSAPQAFTIPEGTTLGQLFSTVGRYLESNPADWNTDAGVVVVKALQTRFPCPKNK
jgi:hypothetical protein